MLNISDFPWAECSLTENRDLHIGDTLGLKRTKRSTGLHRYEFELVTIDMPMTQGRGVKAKLSRAVKESLLYTHPRLSYSQGVEPVAGIAVNGNHSAGAKIISLTSPSLWQLKAGDYLQFSNDTKVYESSSDTALATGIQQIELVDGLRAPITNASLIIVNGVTWYLSSNGVISVDMVASDNQDMPIVLTAVEQL